MTLVLETDHFISTFAHSPRGNSIYMRAVECVTWIGWQRFFRSVYHGCHHGIEAWKVQKVTVINKKKTYKSFRTHKNLVQMQFHDFLIANDNDAKRRPHSNENIVYFFCFHPACVCVGERKKMYTIFDRFSLFYFMTRCYGVVLSNFATFKTRHTNRNQANKVIPALSIKWNVLIEKWIIHTLKSELMTRSKV